MFAYNGYGTPRPQRPTGDAHRGEDAHATPQDRGPTAGGWHPPDDDFLQMIDGCPPAPGLTQWGTYDWRDNFEMWDAFADDEPKDRLARGTGDPP